MLEIVYMQTLGKMIHFLSIVFSSLLYCMSPFTILRIWSDFRPEVM